MAKPDYLLPSDLFQKNLDELVLPYLAERQQELTIAGCDGKPLAARIYRQEQSETVICISHGFCEFSARYSEIIYYFLKEGYSVAIMDHRSHGNSYRPLQSNIHKIHIDTYDTFVEDYHCFVEKVKELFPGYRRYLFGHSMGGCIASLYLETYQNDFQRVVLSSPMLDINTGGVPKIFCELLAKFMLRIGQGENYLGSQNQDWTPSKEVFEESCCTERGRFQAWVDMRTANPHYQTGAGTIAWQAASLQAVKQAGKNAGKVKPPVLLIQAGQDHLILPKGQNEFIRHVPKGRIVNIPFAKHEIFNCDGASRLTFWQEVMSFFAK